MVGITYYGYYTASKADWWGDTYGGSLNSARWYLAHPQFTSYYTKSFNFSLTPQLIFGCGSTCSVVGINANWTMTTSGITGSGDCTSLNGTFTLSNTTGGCRWFSQFYAGTSNPFWEMFYDGQWNLLGYNSTFTELVFYTLADSFLNCDTTNTFALTGILSCSGYPSTITITADTTQPQFVPPNDDSFRMDSNALGESGGCSISNGYDFLCKGNYIHPTLVLNDIFGSCVTGGLLYYAGDPNSFNPNIDTITRYWLEVISTEDLETVFGLVDGNYYALDIYTSLCEAACDPCAATWTLTVPTFSPGTNCCGATYPDGYAGTFILTALCGGSTSCTWQFIGTDPCTGQGGVPVWTLFYDGTNWLLNTYCMNTVGCSACSEMTTGLNFTVSGITGDSDCTAHNGTFSLGYSGGCQWFNVYPGTDDTLWDLFSFDGTNWTLTAYDSVSNVQQTYTFSGTWNCTGVNTLTAGTATACSGWPATIELSPCSIGPTWTLANSSFNCLGSNTLAIGSSSGCTWPSSLTIDAVFPNNTSYVNPGCFESGCGIFPTTLYVTFPTISTCSCISGQTFTLTYNNSSYPYGYLLNSWNNLTSTCGGTNGVMISLASCTRGCTDCSGNYVYYYITASGITGDSDCTAHNVTDYIMNPRGSISSACTWDATYPGNFGLDLWSLFVIGVGTAQLYAFDSLGNTQAIYDCGDYNCLGNNTFTFSSSTTCSGWPATIAITTGSFAPSDGACGSMSWVLSLYCGANSNSPAFWVSTSTTACTYSPFCVQFTGLTLNNGSPSTCCASAATNSAVITVSEISGASCPGMGLMKKKIKLI